MSMNDAPRQAVEGEILPATDTSASSSAAKRVGMRVTGTVVSGNFLPPHLIEQYAQTEQGRRFLDLYFAQGHHRIGLEQTAIKGGNWRANAGLILAFILSLCFLGTGCYLAMNDHDWVGGTVIVSSLGTLVSTFIYGTNSRQQERQEKQEKMTRVLRESKIPQAPEVPSSSDVEEENK